MVFGQYPTSPSATDGTPGITYITPNYSYLDSFVDFNYVGSHSSNQGEFKFGFTQTQGDVDQTALPWIPGTATHFNGTQGIEWGSPGYTISFPAKVSKWPNVCSVGGWVLNPEGYGTGTNTTSEIYWMSFTTASAAAHERYSPWYRDFGYIKDKYISIDCTSVDRANAGGVNDESTTGLSGPLYVPGRDTLVVSYDPIGMSYKLDVPLVELPA
jgi:hypothetical protein